MRQRKEALMEILLCGIKRRESFCFPFGCVKSFCVNSLFFLLPTKRQTCGEEAKRERNESAICIHFSLAEAPRVKSLRKKSEML